MPKERREEESRRNQIIRASRFVVLTVRSMQKISMNTTGSLKKVKTFKFIVMFMDTFTRYVEFSRKYGVCNIGYECVMKTHM